MKYFLGGPLIFGGICGIGVSFLGNVTVDFPNIYPQTLELSIFFGIFSIIAFIGGVYTVFFDY